MKPHPIGKAIISLREKIGHTMSDLAATSDLSKGLMSKLENSPDPNPCYSTLVSVAEGLGITISELLRIIADYEEAK